jgi:L-fuculose-phosphate aldolase
VNEDAARQAGVSPADREDLVAFARRMDGDGLAPGTSGNLSVRRGDVVAITPSGMPYERMGPADICLVRVDGGGRAAAPGVAGRRPRGWQGGGGAVARGGEQRSRRPGRGAEEPSPGAGEDGTPLPGLRPSTETPMHLAVYEATGATAIVHTHSPFVVALSTVLDELPAVHYAMATLGGIVRVAPYVRFGTPELASNAVAALDGRSAVILRNHGALTCGPDLARAYDRAITLEWLARVYWYARLAGTPRTLSEAELDEVSQATRAIRYGEQGPLLPGRLPDD